MADLRKNDEARTFFKTNGYPIQYNDGMLAWLRDYFFISNSSLPDLLAAYVLENGYTMNAPFTPADLFLSSEPGAWYDMTDLSTMWQDTGATTPVTAAGQTCARIDDKSGNGHHAVQATASKRPTVRQDANGVYYLEFDGTDDELINGSMDLSASQASLFATGSRIASAASATGYLFNFGGNYQLAGNAGILLANASSGIVETGGRSNAGTTTGAIGANATYGKNVDFIHVGLLDFSQSAGNEVYIISNGQRIEQSERLTDENTGVLKSSGSVYLGSRGAAVFYKGDIYTCVVRGGLTTEALATRLGHYINSFLPAYTR